MNQTTAEINRIRLEGLFERGRMLSEHLAASLPMATQTVNELLLAAKGHNKHIFSPSVDSDFCKHCGCYFTSEWHWNTYEEQAVFLNQNRIVSPEQEQQ